jgi:hypothetical protein
MNGYQRKEILEHRIKIIDRLIDLEKQSTPTVPEY